MSAALYYANQNKGGNNLRRLGGMSPYSVSPIINRIGAPEMYQQAQAQTQSPVSKYSNMVPSYMRNRFTNAQANQLYNMTGGNLAPYRQRIMNYLKAK